MRRETKHRWLLALGWLALIWGGVYAFQYLVWTIAEVWEAGAAGMVVLAPRSQVIERGSKITGEPFSESYPSSKTPTASLRDSVVMWVAFPHRGQSSQAKSNDYGRGKTQWRATFRLIHASILTEAEIEEVLRYHSVEMDRRARSLQFKGKGEFVWGATPVRAGEDHAALVESVSGVKVLGRVAT